MATSSSSTSSSYLLVSTEELTVEEGKLPSIGEVLRYVIFHYEKNKSHKKVREICGWVVPKIFEYYHKAGVLTRTYNNAVDKVYRLYEKYDKIKANRHKADSIPHQIREEAFLSECNDLCDVSLISFLEMTKDEEIRNFFIMQQQKGRPGDMRSIVAKRQISVTTSLGSSTSTTNIDLSTTSNEMSVVSRESFIDASVRSVTSSLSSIYVQEKSDRNDPDYFDKRIAPKKKKKGEVIDERVAAVLDKCDVSGPCAVHLVVAFLLKLKLDPKEYNVSYSSIRKRRSKYRESIYETVKDTFVIGRGAVVHFDGKLMCAITGKTKVDRLAVKVTYRDLDQLIGVPICDGTGLGIAAAVFHCLEEWKITDFIDACCFDTTGTNTGNDNGAAIFLEQFFNRDLVNLACRHHIYELILKLFFEAEVTTSSGPNVALFERFQKKWDGIDQSKYKTGINHPEVKSGLEGILKISIQFIEQEIEKEHNKKTLRDDYVELLELALMFLGGRLKKKSFQVLFHPPGAMHHARWMSKAIYSLKIFLFREQFHLTPKEMQGLAAVNIFLIRYYIKLWFQCADPIIAARTDLKFIQDMIQYIRADKVMANLILEKMSRHLWYLSEETVAMAFFDDKIPNSVKAKMVEKLRLSEISSSETDTSTSDPSGAIDSSEVEVLDSIEPLESELEFNFEEDDEQFSDDDSEEEDDSGLSFRQLDEFVDCQKRVQVDLDEMISTYRKKDISDFVNRKTLQFFRRFELPSSFLQTPVAKWISDPSYIEARKIAMNFKVTNDTAERGIQLMSDFNSLLTRNEKEKQFVLQVVSFYRKKYKSFNIKDLVQS